MRLAAAGSWSFLLAVVVAFLAPTAALAVSASDVAAAIEARTATLASGKSLEVGGERLDAPDLLAAFYARRHFAPAWSDADKVSGLLHAIGKVSADGLRPEDYHSQAIISLEAAAGAHDADWFALRDLLLTDALAKLADHLRYGKLDPRQFYKGWNISGDIPEDETLALVARVVASDDVEQAVAALAPDHWFYTALKFALGLERSREAEGGWGTVPAGASLKPGMTDPRVPALRSRLQISGDYQPDHPADPDLYDGAIVEAVKRFQERHGLDGDGVVGARTVAALNVTAAQRVDQLRVNLERARWVLNRLGREFIIVNIPGFHLYVMKDGQPVLDERVVVGRTYRQTPMFKSAVKTIVLNPTWTVPPTILKNDVLPKIARDPGYLAAQNMVVVDANGTRLDPAAIDWQRARHGFPYSIVQQPGPENALGRIKFLFPNPYSVYLHDTPHRELFAKTVRTFSSGCIRIEKPMS
ncbi:MAG: L,D-transpeptidase family protein, partial [Alphaproteobacteria bacterium]|nr:L,D-transpeptidase family protein [Alphaproteobacteria bacterium]